MGMVFIALTQIADTFGVTLRSASWVVIAQGLTISAFMLPMGRMGDIIGRKKVHLIGLVLFGTGSVFTDIRTTYRRKNFHSHRQFHGTVGWDCHGSFDISST